MSESYWKATAELPSFPTLKKNVKTDVLIIGGGMAGMLLAHRLHQKGVSYLLLEKGRIGSGVTQNTTAKITAQHGLIYQKLLDKKGLYSARAYLNANQWAVDAFAALCTDMECDFERTDHTVFSREDPKCIERELEALKKIGYEAEFTTCPALPFSVVGGVRFCDQAQFHPLKFLKQIAKGLHIYENTFVREMADKTVKTDRAEVQAERIVVATHFPILNKHGSYFLKLYQDRSYVVALENAADVGGMYLEAQSGGLSLRNADDFLLVGGGGHRTGAKSEAWDPLRRFSARFYPDANERYHWATQDCMSLDGVPYIGQYSKQTPHLYVAGGFNKWGMTGSMVASMILEDLVLEKENEAAELFSPSRGILHPQLFLNGAEAIMNLVNPTPKRCPHMGCALKWNKAEHSWDCPCHGSRFAEDGTLLDNPSNGNLKK